MQILWFILFPLSLLAQDLTADFDRLYEVPLTPEEVSVLREKEMILIPGICAESFIRSDRRTPIELSLLFKEYFGQQLTFFKELGVPVKRLKASSKEVPETIREISVVFEEAKRPLLFITHSLGGMALLDYLLAHPEMRTKVEGIIFLQSPFTGAPMATVVKKYPALSRLFPLVHTSSETVDYLSVEKRKEFLTQYEREILSLTAELPVITAGGVVNGHRSLFSASVSIIRHGCLKRIRGRCIGKQFYRGPFDNSDGMVPFEGSKLPGSPFVRLVGVDHGETVVQVPFRDYNRTRIVTSLIKLLLF